MISRRFSGFLPLLRTAQKSRAIPLLNKRAKVSFLFSTNSRPGAQKM
jgi:hypothetical protein